MSIKKKLARWQKEGLLSQQAADAIATYEKQYKSDRFNKSLFGLGALAIVCGILAIVAANWDDITPMTKIIVHMLLNGGAAYGVYNFARQGKKLHTDVFTLLSMGLNLTLIALVGQVYHLDGTIAGALVLWAILSTPTAMAFGQSKISLLPWMLGVLGAIYLGFTEFLFDNMDKDQVVVWSYALGILVPLGFIQLSALPAKIMRPAVQHILYYAGIVLLVIGGSAASLLWYGDVFRSMNGFPYIGVFIVTGIAAAAIYVMRFPKEIVGEHSKVLRTVLWSSLAAIALPILIPHGSADIIGAAAFIGYWLVLGYASQTLDRQGFVSLAITLIAIRIYVIYLELFGTLLTTGFGLIVSGLVLMGLAYGARKLTKRLSGKVTDGGHNE